MKADILILPCVAEIYGLLKGFLISHPLDYLRNLAIFWSFKIETNGNSERLYFGGSKITADADCSHEIKRRLLLGKKAMTNLDSILKSRDITLPTKVCQIPLPWLGSSDALPLATRMETRLPWRPTRGSLTSPSYLEIGRAHV